MFVVVLLFELRNDPLRFIKLVVSEIANDLFTLPLVGP